MVNEPLLQRAESLSIHTSNSELKDRQNEVQVFTNDERVYLQYNVQVIFKGATNHQGGGERTHDLAGDFLLVRNLDPRLRLHLPHVSRSALGIEGNVAGAR